MKTKKFLLLFTIAAFTLTACDEEPAKADLSSSLDNSVQQLVKAVNEISNSPEFLLFSMESDALKVGANDSTTDSTVVVAIDTLKNVLLQNVAGVYEYSWVRTKSRSPFRLFTKTGESDLMIVKMPFGKAKYPGGMFYYQKNDSLNKNNFVATVTDYLLRRTISNGHEYKLVCGMTLDSAAYGQLAVNKTCNKVNGYDYSSSFTTAGGYTVLRTENSGDTAVSVYNISKEGKTLYEEKMTSTKIVTGETKHRERVYSLSVGNLQVVRIAGQHLDSAVVYLDGVIQADAKVSMGFKGPNVHGSGISNKKRELKITLNDSTVISMSEQLASTIENMNTIFQSVNQATFTSNVIDRIALHLYLRKEK
jgi:hypothetical protein